jgi:hypothetical protein
MDAEGIWSSVTSIGSSAFEFCKNLTQIAIPETVTTIESLAFSNCRNLQSIQLHENIHMEGGSHFWCCKALDNVIYYNTGDMIPGNEFYCCESLKNIDIRCKTSLIGESAFSGTAIAEFSVLKGTKAINRSAFMHCAALKTITIPRSVSRINESAFINCGTKYLTEEQKADSSYTWRGPDAHTTFCVVAGSKADLFCHKKKYTISYL